MHSKIRHVYGKKFKWHASKHNFSGSMLHENVTDGWYSQMVAAKCLGKLELPSHNEMNAAKSFLYYLTLVIWSKSSPPSQDSSAMSARYNIRDKLHMITQKK